LLGMAQYPDSAPTQGGNIAMSRIVVPPCEVGGCRFESCCPDKRFKKMKKQSAVKSKSKTGLPKKNGWYLCKIKHALLSTYYDFIYFKNGKWLGMIAALNHVHSWAPIPKKFTKCPLTKKEKGNV
jgi:hypothetical protein